MDAASLHSTRFAGTTDAEVGRRIGRLRLFNSAMGVVHAVQGAAILVLAASFTLPIVTRSLTGPPGAPPEDHAVRPADRLGRGRVPVRLRHRSPGDRVAHDLPEVPAHAPGWTELLPLGRVLAERVLGRSSSRSCRASVTLHSVWMAARTSTRAARIDGTTDASTPSAPVAITAAATCQPGTVNVCAVSGSAFAAIHARARPSVTPVTAPSPLVSTASQRSIART